jgi:putative transposase
MSRNQRRAMIERTDCPVSLVRQCELFLLARSWVYYQPVATSDENLHLMRLIDQQYLRTPFYGSRRMTVVLQNLGYRVNRKRVQRLMRLMVIEAIYPKPNTSKSTPGYRIYPYLLRGLAVERVNQVWSIDITYVPMRQGFLYLVALIDWHSRYVLSWRLSNTLDVSFCLEALQEALESFGTPEIFNSDQGSQFTSAAFTGVLLEHGVAISMDGRGRCLDNVFVERLWRSVKYEEVYLKAYSDGLEAYRGIGAYLQFFNRQRPHQSLDYQTPEAVYLAGSLKACLEAASTESVPNS